MRPVKISKKRQKRWRMYIAKLEKELPTPLPVIVRVVKLGKKYVYDGDCEYLPKKGVFRIRIDSRTTWDDRWEILVHEYAHVLDAGVRHDYEGFKVHDETWGVCYAKCYTVIEEYSEWLHKHHPELFDKVDQC